MGPTTRGEASRRRCRPLLAATTALMLSLGAVACSSSGSGSGSDAASDADGDASALGTTDSFCAKVKEIQANPPGEDPASTAAAFAELDAVAPTTEIRSALRALRSALEKFDSVMPAEGSGSGDDMAGFEELMKLLMDPQFIAAGETLSAYALKECGIDIDTDLDGDDSTSSGEGTETGGPNIFDDIESGDIGNVVDAYLRENAPQYRISSTTMSADTDHTDIEVALTGSGALKAAAVCRAVDAFIITSSQDPAYAISIIQDSTKEQLAGKQPGQPCTAG